MYCRFCGNKLSDEDKKCPSCGKEVEELVEVKEEKIKIEEEELFSKDNIYDKNRYAMEPTFENYKPEKPEDTRSE